MIQSGLQQKATPNVLTPQQEQEEELPDFSNEMSNDESEEPTEQG
jgi:hypothetical protein